MAKQSSEMSLGTSTDAVLATTTLITGGDEFLAERAIAGLKTVVRAADVDADVAELEAAALGVGALAEIASPSLFAANRCVVVRRIEELADEAVEPLLAYVAEPSPDVALVLHHTGGVKGKATLDKLRKAGAREIAAQGPKRWELPTWVQREFRSHGKKVEKAAAAALVDALGDDLRSLAGAASQLAVDCPDDTITAQTVRAYFGGRADVKGFAVADAAIDGKGAEAIEQLRWALGGRSPAPVLITSAMAAGLRSIARFQAAPRGLREGDLAREVGVPPWKLKSIAAQSRGWSARGLAAAIQAAAQADADVKGAGGDPLWACERLVISVIRARALR
jgi:DNA polymerase-3 subunit delta